MKWRFILCLVFFAHTVRAQEQAQYFFMNGYIKNLHQFSFVDRIDTTKWTTILHNRLNFKWTPNSVFTARLEMRNRFFYGEQVRQVPGFAKQIATDNGFAKASWILIDQKDLAATTFIDRALLNYNKDEWDITFGRQRINWGINTAWNPNDIFNTYNFLDFDYEERPGSDAVRLVYNISSFKSIEFAAKRGKVADDYVVAGLYKFNLQGYDIQFLSGVYQKDIVLGGGWAGNIKDAGFKGELSYFRSRKNLSDTTGFWSVSLSSDYSFGKGYYTGIGILYNSGGANSLTGLSSLAYLNVSPKSLMPFKYAVMGQLSKSFSPLFSGAFSCIYSPTNKSLIVLPNLSYSLANNWELNFTGQSFFAEIFQKYKVLGNSLFFRLRWSF